MSTMNPRLFKKHVRAAYKIVAYCGYCDLQATLQSTPKIGHTERVEGWGCDIYELAPDIALATGYDPFGNLYLPLALTERYEQRARQQPTYEGLQVLITELVNEIRTMKNSSKKRK